MANEPLLERYLDLPLGAMNNPLYLLDEVVGTSIIGPERIQAKLRSFINSPKFTCLLFVGGRNANFLSLKSTQRYLCLRN